MAVVSELLWDDRPAALPELGVVLPGQRADLLAIERAEGVGDVDVVAAALGGHQLEAAVDLGHRHLRRRRRRVSGHAEGVEGAGRWRKQASTATGNDRPAVRPTDPHRQGEAGDQQSRARAAKDQSSSGSAARVTFATAIRLIETSKPLLTHRFASRTASSICGPERTAGPAQLRAVRCDVSGDRSRTAAGEGVYTAVRPRYTACRPVSVSVHGCALRCALRSVRRVVRGRHLVCVAGHPDQVDQAVLALRDVAVVDPPYVRHHLPARVDKCVCVVLDKCVCVYGV